MIRSANAAKSSCAKAQCVMSSRPGCSPRKPTLMPDGHCCEMLSERRSKVTAVMICMGLHNSSKGKGAGRSQLQPGGRQGEPAGMRGAAAGRCQASLCLRLAHPMPRHARRPLSSSHSSVPKAQLSAAGLSTSSASSSVGGPGGEEGRAGGSEATMSCRPQAQLTRHPATATANTETLLSRCPHRAACWARCQRSLAARRPVTAPGAAPGQSRPPGLWRVGGMSGAAWASLQQPAGGRGTSCCSMQMLCNHSTAHHGGEAALIGAAGAVAGEGR